MNQDQDDLDEDFIKLSSKVLDLPESKISSMLNQRILQKVSGPYPDYYRFDKGISGIEAGTAVFQHRDNIRVVKGFPKIQRAIVLDPTLKIHFEGISTIAIEEKMNGYNVRIAYIDGKVIALTRGGLICPYTTEKVREEIGSDFFMDYPDLVLSGEMVGPDNPYVPKNIYPDVKSISIFIFDIREKNTGKSLTIEKKYELCTRYNIKTVRYYGEYPIQSAADIVTVIIKELGEEDREGVVIKDPEMNQPAIKYTSSQSTNNDLKYAFQFYNDYGRDFFFSRVIREGFQSMEWNENEDALHDRCCQLGESILKPMIGTIKKRKQGERIAEDVRIRVKNLETARQFEDHLKRLGVDALFEEPVFENGQYLILIKKINKSTNDRTGALLDGQLW